MSSQSSGTVFCQWHGRKELLCCTACQGHVLAYFGHTHAADGETQTIQQEVRTWSTKLSHACAWPPCDRDAQKCFPRRSAARMFMSACGRWKVCNPIKVNLCRCHSCGEQRLSCGSLLCGIGLIWAFQTWATEQPTTMRLRQLRHFNHVRRPGPHASWRPCRQIQAWF